MKKILIYISVSFALLLAGIIIPNALAQDIEGISTTLEVEYACDWSAGPGSDLTVYDDSLCVITGTASATSVTVEEDLNSNSQYATLIVGSASVDTDFTVSGATYIGGRMEIGVSGNPAYHSHFIQSPLDMTISDGGQVTVTYNTTDDNYIDADEASYIYIGDATTSGTLILDDDTASNSAMNLSIYGTLQNNRGTFAMTTNIYTYASGSIDNNATITAGAALNMEDSSTVTNSGTIDTQGFDLGEGAGDAPVLTNTNHLHLSGGTGDGFCINDGGIVNNNGGTIQIDAGGLKMGAVGGCGSSTGTQTPTLNNNTSGSITVDPTVTIGIVLYNNAQFNITNSSGLVSAKQIAFEGIGSNIETERSTLTNYGTLNIDLLYAGYYSSYGGRLNNESGGTVNVNGTGDSTFLYRGGRIFNKAGAVFDIDGNIGIFQGTNTSVETTSLIDNASTTGNAFRLNSTTVVLNMGAYSKINNTGTFNICSTTTCTSTSVISINANDTDIVNGTGGTLNFNGDVTLGYDHFLDSDGAVNIKGYATLETPNLRLNNTADFYSKGTTTMTGSGQTQKIFLYNSSQLRIGSSGQLNITSGDQYGRITLNDTSSVTNAGVITNRGFVVLYDSSTFTNSDPGGTATLTVDDTGAYSNNIQVTEFSTFTNEATGTVTVDSDTDGQIWVIDSGSYTNRGTTNTWYLNMGRHTTLVDGGTLLNTGTSGVFNVNSTSTSTANPALDLYRGQITNDSTAAGIGNGNFYIKGYLYMLGTGTGVDSATFTNSGVVSHINNLYIYEYCSLALLNGGRWISAFTTNVYGLSGAEGEINVASGAVYSVATTNFGNDGTKNYGRLTNNGQVQRVNIDGTPQNQTTTMTFYNNSTLQNNSGAYFRTYTGTITINNPANFTNAGWINYNGTAGENNGNLYLYSPNLGTNTGTIYINTLIVGSSASYGITFNNNGTVDATTAYLYGTYNNAATKSSDFTTMYVSSRSAYLLGGQSPTTVIATWAAVTNGSFRITIDGTQRDITGIDFTGVATMTDVASRIQDSLRAVTGSSEGCIYSSSNARFYISSVNPTSNSSITVTSAVGSGTDISGAGATAFLDAETGRGTVSNVIGPGILNNYGSLTGSASHLAGLSSVTPYCSLGASCNGTINNDGTTYSFTGQSWIYSNGAITNYATRTASLTSLYVYYTGAVTNNGTLNGTSLYLGASTTTGGTVTNNGSLTYSGNYYYYGGELINAATKTAALNTVILYNGESTSNKTTVTNDGTITGSSLTVGNAGTDKNVLLNNNATGTITNSGTLTVYGAATDTPEFNNYGIFGGAGALYQGNAGTTGGKINNHNSFTRGGGTHYIHNGATFNNYADATATFAGQLHVGYLSGAIATYNQVAGTPGTTKSSFYELQINGYGTFNNNDKITTTNWLQVVSSSARLGEFNGNSGSITEVGGASTVQGIMTIAEGASILWGTTVSVLQSGTTLIPTLTIDGTVTGGQKITVGNNSRLVSGNNSSITLTASPSIQVEGSNPFAEIAGDVNAHSLALYGTNGYMCIGDFQGYYPYPDPSPDPVGTCENAAGSLVNLTGSNANSIYTVPTTNSTIIEISNDVTAAGGLKVRKGNVGTTSRININKDAVVTINGRNADICLGTQYCAIDVGADNNATGAAEMNIYGTVNLETATGRIIGIGYNSSSTGTGTLTIKSDAVNGHGFINDYTNTQLIIERYIGELNIERTDASNYGELYLAGACTVNSTSAGTDGNQGANIDGKMSCYGTYTVTSTGSVDEGRLSDGTGRGEVYVNGSTTSISGNYELDGLLDTGDDDGDSLTVTSTGNVYSGTGTATNFEIIAHDLTIQASGKIASDAKSTVMPGTPGAGSYGGAGEGRAVTTSYGETKLDMTDAPVYGQGGEDDNGLDGNGGGGVRIKATGTITHNGEISADGEASGLTGGGAGAGGTVILIHEPLSTSDNFTGSGVITANGGGSSDATSEAGSGGKITINSVFVDDPDFVSYPFDGTIQALGGTNSSSSNYGSAGTIVYTGDANNPDGTLIVDQNNTTTGSPGTEIPNSGDIIFARVEARNGGEISYEADPVTDPTSCFEVGTGSTVDETYITCTPNPDKAYEMYINNSFTGAQSATEPSGTSPQSVGDLTPAFSFKYMDLQNTTTPAGKLQIQVDNTSDFASPLWDYTTSSAIKTSGGGDVTNGLRTRDIEYNEDGLGTTLSTGTTYYVRARFLTSGTNAPGLWNHLDNAEHYNFEINNYFDIDAACTGDAFAIKDAVNNYPNNNIENTATRRFGKGTCTMNFTSGTASWQIKFGMANGETGFTDGGSNNIDPIPYTTDCDMDPTGMTAEEKYGFNITNLASGGGTIQNDSEQCVSTTYSFDPTVGSNNKYHDVETYASSDKIIAGTVQATAKSFDLNLFANVSASTAVASYTIDLMNIITTDP